VTIGLGTGAVLSIASAIGGAWLYSRWQRRRQQPINRLQRTPAVRTTYAIIGGSTIVIWRLLNRRPRLKS
jgi:hypothetical protein